MSYEPQLIAVLSGVVSVLIMTLLLVLLGRLNRNRRATDSILTALDNFAIRIDGQTRSRVWMVSPTTLMAILHTARHDVLTCPTSTHVGYVEDGKETRQYRATLRRAGHERV